MNGVLWKIIFVDSNDKNLVDRTNTLTYATTDPTTNCVYLSKSLLFNKQFMFKVIIHEFSHCALVSYNLIEEIHDIVYPDKWIEAEERLCNFIYNYGIEIFSTAYSMIGDEALSLMPKEIEKMFA